MAESTRAILTAAGANLAIAVAKFAGASLTGSSSMLAEGIHSVVDTANQALLLLGIRRSERPADARHPFGYGREIYFFSFVVALLIFLAGGLASLYEGIEKIIAPEPEHDVSLLGVHLASIVVNLAILGFALAAEGTSLVVAYRSLPKRAGSFVSVIRRSKDPSLFVVLVEDSAAVAGLIVAAIGVSLSSILGLPALDGVASVTIGFILVGMALFLMRETHGLLIGEPADPAVVAAIGEMARGEPAVRHVNEILTQHLGPEDILVNISLDLSDDLASRDVEALVTRLDRGLKAEVAGVRRVFIEIQSADDSGATKVRTPDADRA